MAKNKIVKKKTATKKKLVKKTAKKKVKKTSKKTSKKTVSKKVSQAYIVQLADDLYRYDDESYMTQFFADHPSIDREYDEDGDEIEDDDGNSDDNRVDNIFDDYMDLIEDEECLLHKAYQDLSEEDKDSFRDKLYNNVWAGVY